MKIALAAIDFEYNNTNEAYLNLVCCSIKTSKDDKVVSFWLHKDEKEKDRLKEYIYQLHEVGYVFLAYNLVAEGRSFLSLDLDPLNFRFLDLYLEYRCLLNHNNILMYGEQYKKGKIVYTSPPKNKWERSEEDEKEVDESKPEYGLGAACFKLLGKQIDNDMKTATRDLIISKPKYFTQEEKEQILEYCESDIEYLIPLFHKMVGVYKTLLGKEYNPINDMKVRSEFAARSAHMEKLGYPIDVEKTRNFSSQVSQMIFACQREINDLFPNINPFYKFKPSEGTYTLNQKAVREEIKRWVDKKGRPKVNWTLTSGGKTGKKDLSLSLKAFTRHFNYTHNYPKDNFFAQMIRYLKLKQNLNGFLPGGKTNFWDYVGYDGFVRPYMGIYTAQSSRSQPKASSFIPLKSAWMRCLISPPKGYAMGSIDYKSQEFLIAALLSKDSNMLEDYATGDVYLAFGKSTSFIPKEGTKAEYKHERDQCKPIVLGLQFDMSEYGLSKDLTEKWGREVSTDEALTWINKHKKAYKDLWIFKKQVQIDYMNNKYIRLADGFYLWGDQTNFRSSGNVPVQGTGACIMRLAVKYAQSRGLKVTYSLHDALYILSPIGQIEEEMSILATCMDEAFRYYFRDQRFLADVGLEGDIWSKEFGLDKPTYLNISYATEFGKKEMEIKKQGIYIDDRGKEEYETFKKYFELPNINKEELEF